MSEAHDHSEQRGKFLQDEVEKCINRCISEADLTYAEVLGALRLVACKLEREYFRLNELD